MKFINELKSLRERAHKKRAVEQYVEIEFTVEEEIEQALNLIIEFTRMRANAGCSTAATPLTGLYTYNDTYEFNAGLAARLTELGYKANVSEIHRRFERDEPEKPTGTYSLYWLINWVIADQNCW